VVVVGGGDSAAEEALYLAKLCKKVYIAHRRDELRASKILQQRIFDDCNIEMLWNTVVTEIKAGSDGVERVALKDTVTADTRELDVDGVFIFIGFIPNNELVPAGTRMNADGMVVTDEKCETNSPRCLRNRRPAGKVRPPDRALGGRRLHGRPGRRPLCGGKKIGAWRHL
jgi:thioredoxin reductase (NADPH)